MILGPYVGQANVTCTVDTIVAISNQKIMICILQVRVIRDTFDFLVSLRREDGYLKANSTELTFTQCASSTANPKPQVASYIDIRTYVIGIGNGITCTIRSIYLVG